MFVGQIEIRIICHKMFQPHPLPAVVQWELQIMLRNRLSNIETIYCVFAGNYKLNSSRPTHVIMWLYHGIDL